MSSSTHHTEERYGKDTSMDGQVSYQVSNGIVEFDGPADPTHPFNWPLNKKSVFISCNGIYSSS